MGTHPIFESGFDCLTDSLSGFKAMRAELCHFSGLKIYPGHGINHCKADGKVIRMLSSKTKQLYHGKKNPRKLRWTILYRRKHKKGISQEASVKRKVRRNVKVIKSVAGLSYTSFSPRNNRSPRSDRNSEKLQFARLKRKRRQMKLTRRQPVCNLDLRRPSQSPRVAKIDQCQRAEQKEELDDKYF